MGKLWSDIKGILKAPFVGQLDLIHLFLVVGAIMVFAIIWAFMLNHIRLAGMEVA